MAHTRDFGWCYLNTVQDGAAEDASRDLGYMPKLRDYLDYKHPIKSKLWDADDQDEFGDWHSNNGVDPYFVSGTCIGDMALEPVKVDGVGTVAWHMVHKPGASYSEFVANANKCLDADMRVGVTFGELVMAGDQIPAEITEFSKKCLAVTTNVAGDAAYNYSRLGDFVDDFNAAGGFEGTAKASVTAILGAVIARWASAKESTVMARLAADCVFQREHRWDPALLEDIMEAETTEEERQSRLLSACSFFSSNILIDGWNCFKRRRTFGPWKANALGPAKVFCQAVGVSNAEFDEFYSRFEKRAVGLGSWAKQMMLAHGSSALRTMAKVAAGGAVAAGVFCAAGLILDWYYEDVKERKLGVERVTWGDGPNALNYARRAKEMVSLGCNISDEVYDVTCSTQVVRLDPFYLSISREINKMKDETAAQRALMNAVLPKVIQNATTNCKTVICLPATISDVSAQHIQDAFPDFYYQVVNRSHSHPEHWAVRRSFEMLVARAVVADRGAPRVVTIGANVRQANKIPGVVANFGPVLTGRDQFRHQKGTASQRQFFNAVNIPERFGAEFGKTLPVDAAVSFFSVQDMTKDAYIRAAIVMGIRKHYIALNIPVIMMDDRIHEWHDPILHCRYRRRGGDLYMNFTNEAVAGYMNSFDATMSWVKPHAPVWGFDSTVSVITSVGSCYLLEMDIGHGRQEQYSTLWPMPDYGHYVLSDVTRDTSEQAYFAAPARKFDQVVKFVLQTTGSKNILEAVAGRIMGLEAQIKIGGTVLERSWDLTHKEFVSIVVHAITCAGVCRSDSAFMLNALKKHYESVPDVTFSFASVVRGYEKLLGLQADVRKPGAADRGANDYVKVDHWECIQMAGGSDPWVTAQGESGASRAEEERPSKKSKDVKDEGYVSGDELNGEDFRPTDEERASGKTVFETAAFEAASTAYNFVRSKVKSSMKRQREDEQLTASADLGPTDCALRLVVTDEEALSLRTSSMFEPGGFLDFSGEGSRSNRAFVQQVPNAEALSNVLDGPCAIPCPDVGAIHVLHAAFGKVATPVVSDAFLLGYNIDARENTLGPMAELENNFHAAVSKLSVARKPQLVIDGLAGSAKSSIVRAYITTFRLSAAIVVPTRVLAADWMRHKVGAVVTKHRLSLNTLRGRDVLVIDEVYAYSKSELRAYLLLAQEANVKVFLVGDRRQQYENGAEITVADMAASGAPILRCLVSNTMPIDALRVAVWAAEGDEMVELFQTRSSKVHSIVFEQRDRAEDAEKWKQLSCDDGLLVFKDRAGPELQWKSASDAELGFPVGKENEWKSISRVQGLRSKRVVALTTANGFPEKWLAEQPGLMYVACSRHSEHMTFALEQSELSRFEGLGFEACTVVNGRKAMYAAREVFDKPVFSIQVCMKDSPILTKLTAIGGTKQTVKGAFSGKIIDDWRPWHKSTSFNSDSVRSVFSAVTRELIGEETPYAQTDAVKMPTYVQSQGLHTLRRPWVGKAQGLNVEFEGLSRLAVPQHSSDEVLDQKNVIERTARPRDIFEGEFAVERQSQVLFDKLVAYTFKNGDGISEVPLTTWTGDVEWEATRSTSFVQKMLTGDLYASTAASTRSSGFLKTQIKVKLKRLFALEENYGQTVLATSDGFNALFGPYSKQFLRNVRLACREGVIIDSGYSDAEVARTFRRNGVLSRLQRVNYQSDVSRQDTSHTPVTLRVFSKLLKYFGVPPELADLYEKHSREYDYKSLHSGLYRGTARYNLGSGDPFTLIRNIFQVITVMIERYDDDMRDMNYIVKGDDFLGDLVPTLRPVYCQELRDVKLTEAVNAAPYHAGRFFLEDTVVPDPVRMICKILVKRTSSVQRANELAASFYDRYVPLTVANYRLLAEYCAAAYSDFEPSLVEAALELYQCMRDRSLFNKLLLDTESDVGALVTVDFEEDCASEAIAFLLGDKSRAGHELTYQSRETIAAKATELGIKVHSVAGDSGDFSKPGLWLSDVHCWAVLGMTEFKEREEYLNEKNNIAYEQWRQSM